MRLLAGRLVLVVLTIATLASCTSSSDGTGESTSPSPTSSASSGTEVSFVVDGTTTYGTLEMPRHAAGKKVSAALLLAGSGPTDRNGDQPGLTPNTLALIAAVLAKQGIASLRFDKYFSGRTGAGAFANDPGKITVTAFEKQADAAYEYLRARPGVDPAKLLVVGHSEGGKYALLVADSVTPRPAGLGLIEPSDQRFLDSLRVQIDEQLNTLAQQGTITAAAAQANADAVARAMSDFRAGRTVDLSGVRSDIATTLGSVLTGTNSAYTRSVDPIVPAELAAKVQRGTRVLVTDGTRDVNIPPSTIGPLARALKNAGTTGPGLVLLRGTDHELHLSGQSANESVIAPDAVTAIEQWARPFASA